MGRFYAVRVSFLQVQPQGVVRARAFVYRRDESVLRCALNCTVITPILFTRLVS